MADERNGSSGGGGEPPLGQRLYDNWALLLVAGILVMVAFYTLWGLVEVRSLPVSPLP
ncbi:MAG TPA: hypothetical protein VNL18_16530 [Gemmatimonadales bacterium]|nr:hypothetical protein [Gemmatimonadales bacterium]